MISIPVEIRLDLLYSHLADEIVDSIVVVCPVVPHTFVVFNKWRDLFVHISQGFFRQVLRTGRFDSHLKHEFAPQVKQFCGGRVLFSHYSQNSFGFVQIYIFLCQLFQDEFFVKNSCSGQCKLGVCIFSLLVKRIRHHFSRNLVQHPLALDPRIALFPFVVFDRFVQNSFPVVLLSYFLLASLYL